MTKPQLDANASRLLAGRYQLLEELDTGGMASVWKGHDQVLGRDVAIKLLREELAADAKFAARFRQEAVHAANLNHQGIVGVFDIGAHDGVPYIVMELVDGRTIRQLLAREGPLPAAQAARIALGVAQALAYAHRLGVVHHNLKPANIMLTQSGTVKVADFAIARAVDPEDPERTGEILGPITHYLAPEQRAGAGADGRADVYALGACLFEMLTGKAPPEPASPEADGSMTTPRMLRAGIPRGLDEIVRKAMAGDPAQRFADAQALLAALREHAGRAMPQPAPAPALPHRSTVPLQAPPARDAASAQAPDAARLGPPRQQRPHAPSPVTTTMVRGRGRWLAPLVAVGIVVTAIAVLVWTGSLRPDPAPATGTSPPTNTAAQQPADVRVPAAAVGSINPKEAGGERNDIVARATDGDTGTAWSTQRYNRDNFGELKAGTGLILQLDEAVAAWRLNLPLNPAGGRAKIYAADQPYGNQQTISPLQPASALERRLVELGWNEVGAEQDLSRRTSFDLSGDRPYRYYLVWLTDLPEAERGGWRLEVREARLFR
jgi:eukaryotic-like serine/threonine-protein kinase